MKLFYVYDPMCSWCWAFQPVWKALKAKLPTALQVVQVVGGLAPDSTRPMSIGMQRHIQNQWRMIEERVPSVHFNFEFWEKCLPTRSTYPACRAVIAAQMQGRAYEDAMIDAIQQAYYVLAENPSEMEVLQGCAERIDLDVKQFKYDVMSSECRHQFKQELQLAQIMGAHTFPSLVLELEHGFEHVEVRYDDVDAMFEDISAHTHPSQVL